MPKRFSRNLLFRLRNDIPVDLVITRVLDIPSKTSEGYLRFLCPLCSEFNSSINPRANLARCFPCNKNFNPIDLVMAEKGISFSQAVSLLTPLLLNPPPDDISYDHLKDLQIHNALESFKHRFLGTSHSQGQKNASP
jgi:DNA primase